MELISGPRNNRGYYFSAPTSPSHLSQLYDNGPSPAGNDAVGSCRLSYAAVPFDWEEKPGTPKSPVVGTNSSDDFAFQVSRNYENAHLSAEDLFDGGVIKPLKPPPRLQIPPCAENAAAVPQRKSPAKAIHSALFSPARLRSGDDRAAAVRRRAARSISPIRGRGLSWTEEEGGDGEKQDSPPSRAAKGGKKWRLKDLFLFQSASEGRASDKDPLKKYTAALRRSSFTEGSESRRGGPVSAHEVHYKANRAVSEDLKKKTFLPYKRGILGRLSFNPAVSSLANGFGLSRK